MNPIEQSKYIEKEFRKYVKSTFQIEDEEYKKCFYEELKKAEICKGPFISLDFPFEKGHSVRELVKMKKLNENFLKFSDIDFDRTLYYHQEKALEVIAKGHNTVITTGTGSGKTESFLYPILNQILNNNANGNSGAGITALFLYPMNALVNDQIERVRKILKNYPQITYGFFTGETDKSDTSPEIIRKKISEEYGEKIPENELVSREEIRNNPPNLFFTNYSMLEYLLIRPNDFNIFSEENISKWQYVVLDEAHTYTGALGIELAVLLRRVAGIANKNPQFILTSATLGDEKNDLDKIISFAESLTTSKFEKDDIIFAKRVPLNNMNIKYTVNPEDYSKIFTNLDNIKDIELILAKYGDFQGYNDISELLYDFFMRDKNVYLLAKELKSSRIKTFKEVLSILNMFKEKELVDFIFLVGKAKNKEGKTIFDSKYHTFIKTLDGAFITLGKNKKMRLTNHSEIENQKAFEIGLCKYCDQMYIMGKSVNGKLLQNSDVDIDENYGDLENINVDYFLIKDQVEELDEKFEDQLEENIVCAKCGKIWLKNNVNSEKCKCGKEYEIELLHIKNEKHEMKNNISVCPCCTRSTTNQSGIVSAFHLNKDSATALLSQILYETIDSGKPNKHEHEEKHIINIDFFGSNPRNVIEKKENKYAKQFIAFSDSRQQASFFATFFEYTHNRFLRKRIIWEELIKNNHQEIKLKKLVSNLENEIGDNKLFDTGYTPFEDAWISILSELLNIDGNYTAEAIGIFAFELDDNFLDEKIDQLSEEQLRYFGISKNEFKTILKVGYSIFRNTPAIDYSESTLTSEIRKEEFGYRKATNYVVLHKNGKNNKDVNGDNRRSFLPVKLGKRENQIYNYVKRILELHGINDSDTIVRFIETLFDFGIQTGLFKTKTTEQGEKLYTIPADRYVVKSYKNMTYYRCPICEKMTQYNVKNVCPTKFCKGILQKVDPDIAEADNYYRSEYMNKKIERVVVKEHTAQLDRKKGREYQRNFKDKNINVLSCSTTFEMGIDIGHLENVFLRNVPPTPANYAQRAGRAGRSKDASAFVLTFCGANSHDYTYFKDPTKMIAGNIMPPKLKITNEKIILRHIMASALGYFFRNKPQFFESIDNLVFNDGIEELKKYINSKPEELGEYIDNRVLDNDTRKSLGNFKWVNKVLSEGSELQKFYDERKAIVSDLEKAEEQAALNKEYNRAKYFNREILKIKRNNVISELSGECVIPKYGFPVDVVELKVFENGERIDKYNLSRDLSIAISEYAPDSEVIVDDKKYTSRFILRPKTRDDFTEYYYYECPVCERMNVQESLTNEIVNCRYCKHPYPDVIKNYYIEPIYGFATDIRNKESKTKRPRKTYSGEYKYLGDGISNNDKIEYNGIVTIESARDDKLLVLNSNPFFKCPVCGYTILDKKRAQNDSITLGRKHQNHLGYDCPNTERLYKVSLGHTFKTDVIKIGVLGLIKREKALSTLYALIEGIAEKFDIERRDINGLINKTDTGEYEMIIFDNVPGGAGHVKRILESNNLKSVFTSAYNVVNRNCCDEDTSCYNCLRTFNNQKVHQQLKRKYAKEILQKIINGLDNSVEEKISKINLKDVIDFNSSYSLSPYKSWDEIEMFFMNINVEEYNNRQIRIPDYANSYIKLPNGKTINTNMLWIDENIAVVGNDEDLFLMNEYGVNTFIVDDIDYEKIKEIVK